MTSGWVGGMMGAMSSIIIMIVSTVLALAWLALVAVEVERRSWHPLLLLLFVIPTLLGFVLDTRIINPAVGAKLTGAYVMVFK